LRKYDFSLGYLRFTRLFQTDLGGIRQLISQTLFNSFFTGYRST
jgi:hypothetical protein